MQRLVWRHNLLMEARLIGVELYFEDLETPKSFYCEMLGLKLSEEEFGRFAKIDGGPSFLCLERKGAEGYPSVDKAVVFLEVSDLRAAVDAIGRDRIVQSQLEPKGQATSWAVLHDPEGHDVLLIERTGS